MKKQKKFTRMDWLDKSFDVVNFIMMTAVFVITVYPLIIVVSSSCSSAEALMAGKVRFLPVDFTLDGYKAVFANKNILTGLENSIFYTVVGTFVQMTMTILAAYPLSRNDFKLKGIISLLFALTMWFSGGLIPTYLLVRNLGLFNTRLALILPSAFSVWNMVIVRTYFQSNINAEMLEAAKIDGCDDFRYLWQIAIPLSTPVIAVIALYYAVANWNVFQQAYMYIQDQNLFPIQVVLRDILLLSQTQELSGDVASGTNARLMSELLKYAVVVVASLPMVIVYPFVQKFFVKGIMVGGVKG